MFLCPISGLNKLLPYLNPYRFIMISMVILGLLTSTVDIILPLFQQYALNPFHCPGNVGGTADFRHIICDSSLVSGGIYVCFLLSGQSSGDVCRKRYETSQFQSFADAVLFLL